MGQENSVTHLCSGMRCERPFRSVKETQVIDSKNSRRVRNAKVEGSIPFRSTNPANNLHPIPEIQRAPNVRRFRPRGTPYRYLRGWRERRSMPKPIGVIGHWSWYRILLVRFRGKPELRYVSRE